MIKKIMKSTFVFLMIFSVLFSYFVNPTPIYAKSDAEETLGDKQKELEDLKRQKREIESQKEETKRQIQAKKDAIAQAEKDIAQAEIDIEEAEEKIVESNKKIEGLKEQTENIMKALQQLQSKNVYVEYVSDASSITDLVMRIAAIEQITSSNQRNLEELKALIKENEQLKKDLAEKQKYLEKKIPEYQNAIESLYGNLESYDMHELDIDTKIKTAETNVKMYEELSKNIFGTIKKDALIIELMANSSWLKPLNKGTVTSPEGYRTHPVTGQKYSFHSGIDIGGNAEGTSVYAAAGGTVSGIVPFYSCGGNMLYIDVVVDGKPYTTYYYHLLTINVKVGDVVDHNTIIGTVGGGPKAQAAARAAGKQVDGCSTGAHLHFGVKNGFYSAKEGTPASKVIVPPGFRNVKGYSWTTRTAFYK